MSSAIANHATATADAILANGCTLNFFQIANAENLEWPVAVYRCERRDGEKQTMENSGDNRAAFYEAKYAHRSYFQGDGFIVSVDHEHVMVPETWQIDSVMEVEGFRIHPPALGTVSAANPGHEKSVAGILREGFKHHFKTVSSPELGPLWRDFGDYCEFPKFGNPYEYHFCRKYMPQARLLRHGIWGVTVSIATVTIDGSTLADYLRAGEAELLADRIRAKRQNRLTRDGQPSDIRVLRVRRYGGKVPAEIVELDNPDTVLRWASDKSFFQAALKNRTIRVKQFPQRIEDVPLDELRLVLDTQITQDDHAETILEPTERLHLAKKVRDHLNGAMIYGKPLVLANSPLEIDAFPTMLVPPPAIRAGCAAKHAILASPTTIDDLSLRRRGRARMDHLRDFGFLEARDIDPLLAVPRKFGIDRARRLKSDLNYLLHKLGIQHQFERLFEFDRVEEVARQIESAGHDALVAVLPEGSNHSQWENDTHEQIKRRVDVPSQCIHFDNTLPLELCNKRPRDLDERGMRTLRRVRQRYELVIWNLLTKCHWVPFAPAESSYFNTQVGLDVGGRDDSHVMACLGYGFSQPDRGLYFRPEQIHVNTRKAEPIPTDSLYSGLLSLFQRVHDDMSEANESPQFGNTLFYRDGRLLGQADRWNEFDALQRLHAEFVRRGWVTESAVWAAIEIMKQNDGWRLLRGNSPARNPIVGQCVFPFEDQDTALVCTTGGPYLPQGTANPIKAHVIAIAGKVETRIAIRDLVWQADLGFTKPDMGLRLPWVLHVADSGALQVSRAYRVPGITA